MHIHTHTARADCACTYIHTRARACAHTHAHTQLLRWTPPEEFVVPIENEASDKLVVTLMDYDQWWDDVEIGYDERTNTLA